MAFNFPSSPTLDQTYTSGSSTYKYNGSAWIITAAAAPFDAMAYSGIQINGSMEINQELGISQTSNPFGHVCDGWLQYYVGSMVLSGGAAPPGGWVLPGFTSRLFVYPTTAQPTLNPGDGAQVFQRIEGYRISRLGWGAAGAKPITISFWSGHFQPGIYSVTLRSSNGDRGYVTSYVHAVSNVWQYNTVTIPGCTDGTWASDNTQGMFVGFAIADTAVTPSPNVWTNTLYGSVTGQVNGVASTSDMFLITGVTILPGTQAPTAAQSPLIMRPYGEELATCQRYFQGSTYALVTDGYVTGAGVNVHYVVPLPVQMRVTPTAAVYDYAVENASNITLFGVSASTFGFYVISTGAARISASLRYTLDARL